MFWKVSGDAEIMSYSTNHIDVKILASGMGSWRLTGLYGEPNRSLCRNTWDLMRNLKDNSDLPWCLIGDFNNVITQVDKRGGNPYPGWLLKAFSEQLTIVV